jgi:hypothetical protein
MMNMNIDIDDLENMRYLFMEQIEHFKGGGGGGGGSGGGGRGSSKRKNKSPYFSIFMVLTIESMYTIS